jgi:hypothetical protein
VSFGSLAWFLGTLFLIRELRWKGVALAVGYVLPAWISQLYLGCGLSAYSLGITCRRLSSDMRWALALIPVFVAVVSTGCLPSVTADQLPGNWASGEESRDRLPTARTHDVP